jgi:hypothetical protein
MNENVLYIEGDGIMDFYEQLTADSLISLYLEMTKDIENGQFTKNGYYELGLMISAASKKGITLGI